jgi:hypothetical protein
VIPLNVFLEILELSANTPLLFLLNALFLNALANHVTSVKLFLDALSELMEPLNALTLKSLATTDLTALWTLAIQTLELVSTPMFQTPPLAQDLALKTGIVST